MSEAFFFQGKKDPGLSQQIHDQEDAVDSGKGRVRPLGTDVVELVSVFTLTEFAFDGDALQILLPALLFSLLQLITVFIGRLFRSPQRLAGKVVAALLEVVAVVAGAVERTGVVLTYI